MNGSVSWSSDANSDKFRSVFTARWQFGDIGKLVLKVSCHDALLGGQEVAVDVAEVLDLTAGVANQVSENPAHAGQPEALGDFIHPALVVVRDETNLVSWAFLRGLVNGHDHSLDA